jgi:alginate O-acetyltransferase complex protein AlgI
MIFNEAGFFVLFLLPTAILFHAVAQPVRPWIIALGGVGFFSYFGWLHFGGLWGALAVLLFFWELLTSRLYRPGSRWCLYGIVQAVLILGAFKYLRFFIATWNSLIHPAVPLAEPAALAGVALPLGISFFTFEFIHYAADVYTGRLKGSRWGEYASFIFFFPTMVAGPIKRFQEFVPQLTRARFDAGLTIRGLARIGVGLAKKHALADTCGLWADQLTATWIAEASPAGILLRVLAYGGKIYFDFSGYSDIAIGSGNLFGVAIPENFNWPYLSRNIAEFWRRWHISLGRWIFDYVYVPLGGSRKGEGRAGLNLLTAFAISGLWHGAAWNFIAWGVWHGLLMVAHRVWRTVSGPRQWAIPDPLAIAITFLAVNAGWALFCMDLPTATLAGRRILGMP